MMQSSLADGIIWYAVFLFSTVCHEAAHAWSALKLGDDTAYRGGQVSLNPVPHIRREFAGMVVVPILAWFLGGWIMGWASAPYDPVWARNYPRRAALMALAGPATNLLLVLAAALLIRLGVEWNIFTAPFTLNPSRLTDAVNPGVFDVVAKILSVTLSLNLLLCVFNLLPVPPLDGSNAMLLFLPQNAVGRYYDALRSPLLRMVGLIIAIRFIGGLLPNLVRVVGNLFYPHIGYQ
jgi:Zn-dependent protease